jgi:hypothetical protein
MTEADMLVQLKKRAITVRLRGKGVDSLVERDTGPPGLFMPPLRRPKTAICLRAGRTDRKTLFTLCHELGHFWAYATDRRTPSYGRALFRYQDWESTVTLNARNTDAVLKYPKFCDVPQEVYAKALEDVERNEPNPLAEEDRREILAEEARAWCFGGKIALAFGISDTEAFCVEASTAMGFYYQRLKLPCVAWTPTSCNCNLTPEDERFVVDLTAPDSPRTE